MSFSCQISYNFSISTPCYDNEILAASTIRIRKDCIGDSTLAGRSSVTQPASICSGSSLIHFIDLPISTPYSIVRKDDSHLT